MGIQVGTKKVKEIWHGTKKVKEVWVGAKKIWSYLPYPLSGTWGPVVTNGDVKPISHTILETGSYTLTGRSWNVPSHTYYHRARIWQGATLIAEGALANDDQISIVTWTGALTQGDVITFGADKRTSSLSLSGLHPPSLTPARRGT